MKLFNFVYEVEDDGGAVHAIEGSSPKKTRGGGGGSSPASTASASSSSRFGFSSPFGKKSPPPSSSSSVAPTPPSPVRSSNEGKASTKKGKKAPPPPQSHDYCDEDCNEDYNGEKSRGKRCSSSSSKKSSKESPKSSSSACCCCCCNCNCSTLLTYGFFLVVATVIGVLTWRYGPWARGTATTTAVSLESSSASCPDCCNGKASYCDLTLDNVVFPAVRRAHSSYANNFVAASNSRPFEEALTAGYRALQFNTCVCEALLSGMLLERNETWGLGDSNLGFCDTVCAAGVRDPSDVLSNLHSFIEANTREVLIVEFDMGDGSSPDLRTALVHSGLVDYVYVPPQEYAVEWPTLGEMIESGKRLVLFGSGDGMASCPANKCKDGILHAADHVAETYTGYGADLASCEPSTSGEVLFSLFRLNHYVEKDRQMPRPGDAREMNAYANLETRMGNCRRAGYMPNLLAVEFWDEGDAVAFAHDATSGEIGGGGGGDDDDDDDEKRRRLRSPGSRDVVSMRKN